MMNHQQRTTNNKREATEDVQQILTKIRRPKIFWRFLDVQKICVTVFSRLETFGGIQKQDNLFLDVKTIVCRKKKHFDDFESY